MNIKRILITGKGSYIGTSFKKWVQQWSGHYQIVEISVRGEDWKGYDFSCFDVVLHVAAIAHKKETKSNAELYNNVNRDLVVKIAQKAKSEGVKHFIFLSSMSVYGIESGVIDINTSLKPSSHYGKSKLQAENLIQHLNDSSYSVAIIRPPMVYGKGCKGNYTKISKISSKTLLFPELKNIRSMIYIDNLCEFIRLLIDDNCNGIYFPQNKDYVCTSNMVSIIANINGNKVRMTKLFNSFIKIFKRGPINKVFGSLVYDQKLSCYKHDYNLFDFYYSLLLTEGNEND